VDETAGDPEGEDEAESDEDLEGEEKEVSE